MFFSFSVSKVRPFRDLRNRPRSKAEFLFLKPLLTSLLRFSIFVSLQMLYLYLFSPVSACVLTQSRTLPVTHAAKQTHNSSVPILSRTCGTRSRTPGPAHQGGEDGAPVEAGSISLEEMNLAPQH